MFLRRRVPENGPLKAAAIGAGAFGRHHATKYRALSESGRGVELFAIADPSTETRRLAAAQFGVLAVCIADAYNANPRHIVPSICGRFEAHALI